TIRYRLPGLGEGLARGNAAVEIDAVARQGQVLGADAADQRQPRRELQPVLDRDRDIVELAVAVIRLRYAIETGHRIDHVDRVGRECVRVAFLAELDLVAACRQLRRE